MATETYTKRDFAQKLDWEGGVVGGLAYWGREMPTIKGVGRERMERLRNTWLVAAEALGALEAALEDVLPEPQ